MTSEILELGDTPGAAAAPAIEAREPAPRWVVPVVAGLCAVALVLRAAIALHSGVFRDEGELLDIVGSPSWGAMLDFLRQHESHPPLFYAVMRLWRSLAGDSDAAALAIPIALGGALVPSLYAVGARLLSWRIGLFAATAAALSPVVIDVGAMARPYSLLPLLTLWATYALVRAVDLRGAGRWAAYAAAMLALVYTHNWGWLVLAAHWVALAVCLGRGVPRPRAAVLRGWAGAQAAIAIGFLAWVPSLLHQVAHAGYPSDSPFGGPGRLLAVLIAVASLLVTSTLTLSDAAPLPAAAVLWTLTVSLLAVAVGRRWRWRSREPLGSRRIPVGARTAATVIVVTPFAAVAGALALSPRTDLLVPHCVAMLAPLMLLLVGGALDRWRAAGQAWLAATAAVAMVVGYAVMLPALYQQGRSNAREVAGQVAAEAAPTDLVMFGQWWLASSFNRYYPLPTEQIDFPALARMGAVPYDDAAARIGDPAALAEAERRLAAAHAAGRRVWLVTEGQIVSCLGVCEAKALGSRNYGVAASLRTAQLQVRLTELYGPPLGCRTGPQGGGRHEGLSACLFGPS